MRQPLRVLEDGLYCVKGRQLKWLIRVGHLTTEPRGGRTAAEGEDGAAGDGEAECSPSSSEPGDAADSATVFFSSALAAASSFGLLVFTFGFRVLLQSSPRVIESHGDTGNFGSGKIS